MLQWVLAFSQTFAILYCYPNTSNMIMAKVNVKAQKMAVANIILFHN